MSDCVNTEVRDALPDLLNGRLSELDTATMKAHVESCADCRAELELLRQAKTSALLAPKMDASRIASAIPAYPHAPTAALPAARATGWRFSSLRMIAVAAVVATAGLVWSTTSKDRSIPTTQSVAASQSPVTAEAVPAPATENPSTAESSVVKSSPAETRVASLSLVGGTSDLSDADLEQLVSELDQLESLPAEEPQSVTTTVEDIGSDEDSGL